MNGQFNDKSLACKDCGKEFVWTTGEQEFFAQKGFANAPTRCPDCRRTNRQQRQASGPRQMYQITCSSCGKAGEVPFEPRDPSAPVYCADCFRERRAAGDDAPAKPADEPAPAATE